MVNSEGGASLTSADPVPTVLVGPAKVLAKGQRLAAPDTGEGRGEKLSLGCMRVESRMRAC